MSNTVPTAGEAMPGATLSRRAVLMGAAALPGAAVLGAFPASAAAGTKTLAAVIEAHRAAASEYYAAADSYADADEAAMKADDKVMVAITCPPNGGKPPAYISICARSDARRYADIKAQICRKHDELGKDHLSPFGVVWCPEGAVAMKKAVGTSRRKALAGLRKAIAENEARSVVRAFREADARFVAAADAVDDACVLLFAYRPRDKAEAAERTAYVQGSEHARGYLNGTTGCHEDRFIIALLHRLLGLPDEAQP